MKQSIELLQGFRGPITIGCWVLGILEQYNGLRYFVRAERRRSVDQQRRVGGWDLGLVLTIEHKLLSKTLVRLYYYFLERVHIRYLINQPKRNRNTNDGQRHGAYITIPVIEPTSIKKAANRATRKFNGKKEMVNMI